MARTQDNTIEDTVPGSSTTDAKDTADDTFDFSNAEWDEGDYDGDGVVDGSDFNIWNEHRFQEDDDEPGLAGVTVYADLNYNGSTYDTSFDGDFIV